MAARLVSAGYEVRGFDVSEGARESARAAGVAVHSSVAAAARDVTLLITMLPNGSLVRQVLLDDGALDAATTDATIIDSSTIDIADARELHELVSQTGRHFLDAPVSGGVNGATAGTLTFMVGGDPAVLQSVSAILDVMAGRVFHTGGAGAGQAAKIVNNMMLGINLAGLCEGVVLAERLGLDARTFYELASVSSGDSWALRTWYPVAGVVETAAVNRDFAGGFATDLLAKDLKLALTAGEANGVPLPHAVAVAQAMKELQDLGHGGEDCTVLVRRAAGDIS